MRGRKAGEGNWRQSLTLLRIGVGRDQTQNGLDWSGFSGNVPSKFHLRSAMVSAGIAIGSHGVSLFHPIA